MSFNLYIGPMFAGKTSRMLIDMSSASHGLRSMLFKAKMDNRDNTEKIKSHSGMVKSEAIMINTGKDILEYADDYDIYGIDELHFMGKDIHKVIKTLLCLGKCVFATGLNSDYRRKTWISVYKCIPYASSIIFLSGKCSMCESPSTCSYLKNSKKYKDCKELLISSSSIFIPLCSKCYMPEYES
mgnify:CR=1 FL=1